VTKHIEIPEADYLAMREEIEQLRVDLHLTKNDLDDANKTLEAFKEFDDDADMWAMMKRQREMKRQRDEALATIATAKANLVTALGGNSELPSPYSLVELTFKATCEIVSRDCAIARLQEALK
jgi:hypothetical protein